VTQTERVTRCSCALFCIRQYRTHSIVAGVSAGKQKRPRRAVQILLTLFALYVVFALFVMLMQRKLIYYPSKFSSQAASRLAREEARFC
jgi:hypothetical protein